MHITTWMNLRIIRYKKVHAILLQQYKSLKKRNIIYGDKNLISSCPGVNWNGDQEILGV